MDTNLLTLFASRLWSEVFLVAILKFYSRRERKYEDYIKNSRKKLRHFIPIAEARGFRGAFLVKYAEEDAKKAEEKAAESAAAE